MGSNLNLDERYTVDWSTGKVSVNGGGVKLISGENGAQAFALDEWVGFTMIIDRTGNKDVHYLRFESSLGTKEYKIQTNFNANNYKIENSNPRFLIGNGWVRGGSAKPYNPSLYIDNVEMYVTDYNVVFKNSGQKGVEASNKIVLDIEGDIDEKSLSTITVYDGTENAEIKNIEYSDNICTITLAEKMKEFTEYTIDYLGVASETGIKKNFPPASFVTAGKVELNGGIKLDKIAFNVPKSAEKLEKGLIQTEFTVENNTSVDVDDVIIMAKIINGGTIEALSYKKLTLPSGGKSNLICAFIVPDENCRIELCAKNSINGTVYYTDIYTVDKNGISNAQAEDSDKEQAGLNIPEAPVNGVKFYSITLGDTPVRTEADKLTPGLAESAANINSSGDAMLISVLKKDGLLKSCVYTVRENTADSVYTAVNVPDSNEYTLDSFVWDSIAGAKGYIGKTTISSVSEGN